MIRSMSDAMSRPSIDASYIRRQAGATSVIKSPAESSRFALSVAVSATSGLLRGIGG